MVSLLRSSGIPAQAFGNSQEFLSAPLPEGPTCLILDVRLPRLSGLDLQAELRNRARDVPIIFITGHGTIPMTVKAMKAGAVEFLTKPFSDEELLDAVRRALERDAATLDQRKELAGILERHASLTKRERTVMSLVVAGKLNKQIGYALGTSEITIKVHRRHVMEKMRAASLADLVRMSERMDSQRTAKGS